MKNSANAPPASEEVEKQKRLPKWIVAAPVVMYGITMFVGVLAYDHGGLGAPSSDEISPSLFVTQVAKSSVLPTVSHIPFESCAPFMALMMMHGLLTASIIIFLAALGRLQGSNHFRSKSIMKLVLFLTFFRSGASMIFIYTENHLFGLMAWASGSLSWLGLAFAFANEVQVAYPSAWRAVPFFLGNYKHIPIAGYGIGGMLSCLVILQHLRFLCEPAAIAVLLADLAAVHRAWSLLPGIEDEIGRESEKQS